MRTKTFLEMIVRERSQIRIYALVAIGAVALVAIPDLSGQRLFRRFIGASDPVVVALLVSAAGFVALAWLRAYGGFAIYRVGGPTGLVRAAGFAAGFGVIAIAADFRIVYPADTNVPFPESLWFYPAIGFFAEIVFHALPLAALLLTLKALGMNLRRPPLLLLCVVFVALLEPVYQLLWMASSGSDPMWAKAFVGLHVFLINLTQLLLFRRYDFVTMLAFRILYYLIWHIGWGYFRLFILF
jgi:hypothetical protein